MRTGNVSFAGLIAPSRVRIPTTHRDYTSCIIHDASTPMPNKWGNPFIIQLAYKGRGGGDTSAPIHGEGETASI
jgi:hypothetical protein